MKRQVKKWSKRLIATGLLLAGIFITILLYPVLTYAHATRVQQHTIYHQQQLDAALPALVDQAVALTRESELYNPELALDICLNDGSVYPDVAGVIRQPAFAWGFYNKVVLQGHAACAQNTVELNGYSWNLAQLLAHEMVHCMQFDRLGLLRSNPVAGIAEWKWEGYAEYIARGKDKAETALRNSLDRLKQVPEAQWEVAFPDGTITPRAYEEHRVLVLYCLEVKKMSYEALLDDTLTEPAAREEMMRWYGQRK